MVFRILCYAYAMFDLSPLAASLLSGLFIALIALIGFGSLLIAKRLLSKMLAIIVAFAAGALLGGAFFHLLPEALELNGPVFEFTLIGLLVFFVLDSLLWIYHCHAGHRLHEHENDTGSCPTRPIGVLNLFGDALHNLTDGIVIASAFMINPALGISTTLAVALHEIPQEVGDFGILIHSGFSKKKALLLNFAVALTVLFGIIITFLIGNRITGLTSYTIPFAAGGFIYMACTNLLSEIKEESSLTKRLWQTLALFAGVGLLWYLAIIE